MLIINKNVRFSIKLSRLWRVCSILVLQSLVYWIFFVAFSQNRTIITAVCASLAAPIVCHAKAGLVVPRRCFALRSRGSCRVSKQPQLAGKKGAGKAWPEPDSSPGPWVSSLQRKQSSNKEQFHPGCAGPSHSLPQKELHMAFVFSILSFVLINEQMINNNPYW